MSYIFPPEGFVVAICFIMLISQCGTVLSWRGTVNSAVAIGKVNTTIELSREGSEEGRRGCLLVPCGCEWGDKVWLGWSIDFNIHGDLPRFSASKIGHTLESALILHNAGEH